MPNVAPDTRRSAALGLALLFSVGATSILTPLLPDIQSDFGISISAAGFIVAAYGLARLAIDLPAGYVVGRLGERGASVLAAATLLGGSLLGYWSPSPEVLIAARVVSGLGAGLLSTTILTALGRGAPRERRGQAMSIYQMASNGGTSLYPLLGSGIAVMVGWRATFLVNVVGSIIAGAILVRSLPVHASVTGSAKPTEAVRRRAPAGRLAVVYFGVVANMVGRHGFRNTVLPLYAAAIGLGTGSIGAGIALMAAVGFLVSAPGGWLSDQVGRAIVIALGLAIVALGTTSFLVVSTLPLFLAACFLVGLSDFFAPSQTALLVESVPDDLRPRALAGYRFAVDVGALTGPIVLAAVMDRGGASTAIILAATVPMAASLATCWRFGVGLRSRGVLLDRP